MAKLGYTWYPQNWNNSDRVFDLTLAERGLYRELIDRAMTSDNKVVFNVKKMVRRLNSSVDEINNLMENLTQIGLVENNNGVLFLPECESRLKIIRGGRKGGQKSRKNKPNSKPKNKPNSKPSVKPKNKPNSNQIESNNNNNNNKKYLTSLKNQIGEKENQLWRETFYIQFGLKQGSLSTITDKFINHLILTENEDTPKKSFEDFKTHLFHWVKIEIQKNRLAKFKKHNKGDL